MIRKELESGDRQDILAQIKALDSGIIRRILDLFNWSDFAELMKRQLHSHYADGLEKAGEATGRNYTINDGTLKFLQDYTFDNVKNLQDEAKNDLRQILQRGIMERKPVSDIASEIKSVLDISENRANMIAATELARANNMGEYDGIKQSGLKFKKKWNSVMDGRTSEVCKHLDGEVKDIGDKFNYKDLSAELPPIHCNCRSRVVYLPQE